MLDETEETMRWWLMRYTGLLGSQPWLPVRTRNTP